MPRAQTILIIDDSPTQARRYADFLTQRGLNVFVASKGGEGLRLAETVQPALILLDLRLPDMTGKQVLNRIRRHPKLQSTQVFIFTVNDDPQARESTLASGADAFIIKDGNAANIIIEKLLELGWVVS
jgi:CheY-like chemotaxis protein